MRSADELLEEAATIPFRGWDFTTLGDRIRVEGPPWNLAGLVDSSTSIGETMLDMGTGGGEWLSSLAERPRRVVASESWPPNVLVAAARFRPLGIAVVQDEGAVDNVEQRPGHERGRLPFRDGAFSLVTNRHESFVATEVSRVMTDGGLFITQQASSGSATFHELLQLEAPLTEEFSLSLAIDQLTSAGMTVEQSGEGEATTTFADVGALAWYLLNVPWAVPGFSISAHRARLLDLVDLPIPVSSGRFWLRARREPPHGRGHGALPA